MHSGIHPQKCLERRMKHLDNEYEIEQIQGSREISELSIEQMSAMTLVLKIFSDYKDIESNLSTLFDIYSEMRKSSSYSAFEEASFMHNGNVCIRPYAKGNGRTARKFLSTYLESNGFEPLEKATNSQLKMEYYKVVAEENFFSLARFLRKVYSQNHKTNKRLDSNKKYISFKICKLASKSILTKEEYTRLEDLISDADRDTLSLPLPKTIFYTPLHLACFVGNIRVVTLLLKNGADPLMTCENGKIPGQLLAHDLLATLPTSIQHQLSGQADIWQQRVTSMPLKEIYELKHTSSQVIQNTYREYQKKNFSHSSEDRQFTNNDIKDQQDLVQHYKM